MNARTQIGCVNINAFFKRTIMRFLPSNVSRPLAAKKGGSIVKEMPVILL
jgi:hypothetical protein